MPLQHKRAKKNFGSGDQWAKKRENKRNEKAANKEPTAYEHKEYLKESPKFDEYYKAQFASIFNSPSLDEEFTRFTNTLKDKLPVTFRVNSGEHNFKKLCDLLRSPDFITRYTKDSPLAKPDEYNSYKTSAVDYDNLRMDCKPYYPNESLFEMMIPREMLKKNVGLKKIHTLVMAAADSGLITRQEIVSMIPPLLLDIKSEHSIFDMCAAPGSKTAQMLELMMADHLTKHSNETRPSGFLVANDADHKRACMLTHQMNRLNQANLVITNHFAQNFPSLLKQTCKKGEDRRVLFDRVCCDVPCSSDAAIRKIPQKWPSWNTKDSQSLHPLQIQILRRGIETLKVGGKLTYSTCSLNPIENESVVAAALKEFAGKIKLNRVSIPGFRHQEGLKKWRFLHSDSKEKIPDTDTFFTEFQKYEEVPDDRNKWIKETMFTSHYTDDILNELDKCVRVMPHHQNTSGFFITVIEKIAETGEPVIAEADMEGKYNPILQKDARKRDFTFYRCDPQDPDVQYIMAYYGLTLPAHQLVVQDQQQMGRVLMINESLSLFMQADTKHELCLVTLGVTALQRNLARGKSAGVECIFRLSQDGAHWLIPFMQKRIVYTDSMVSMKALLQNKYHDIDSVVCEKMKKGCDDLTVGCFMIVVRCEGETCAQEPIIMHRFVQNMSCMFSKEHLFSMQMRFLTPDEQETCNTIELFQSKEEKRRRNMQVQEEEGSD